MSEYYCPYCFVSVSEKKMEKHIHTLHINYLSMNLKPITLKRRFPDNSIGCPECGIVFGKVKTLRKHYFSHYPKLNPLKEEKKDLERHTCPYCKELVYIIGMDEHFKVKHNYHFTYKDYLTGKKKEEIYKLEKDLIPVPITKVNSENVNCPVCEIILAGDKYEQHYREDHKDILKKDLHEHWDINDVNDDGFVCPESYLLGHPHKNVFVCGTYKSKKLEERIPEYFCQTCGKTYISEQRISKQELVTQTGKTIINFYRFFSPEIQKKIGSTDKKDILKVEEPKTDTVEEKVAVVTEKDYSNIKLIVYDGLPVRGCHSGANSSENIVIKTQDIHGNKISINAFKCKKCGMFYTNYETVRYYLSKKPLITIECAFTIDERRDFSELSLLGYNVNQNDLGSMGAIRQKLLQDILDNRLIEKSKVISLLHSFINFTGKRKNMEHAVECWKKDLKFVSDYVIPTTKKIKTDNIVIEYKDKLKRI